MLCAPLTENEIRRVIGVPGEGNRAVEGIASLEANEDRCLYFVNKDLAGPRLDELAALNGCIVIARLNSGLVRELGDCVVLETADPRASIAKVLGFVRDENRHVPLVTAHRIAASAVISPLAVIQSPVDISDGVVIEPFCIVGPDVRLGRDTVLRSGARLFPRVSVGDNSLIGVNSVVGHEGHGFVRDDAGNKMRIPHLGGVSVGSHVELGAQAIVQSGTISPTTIEDYAKLGDRVGIGHNVRIGRNVSMAGGASIAGGAVIETEAWLGINCSVREGCRVGARALVGMNASVQRDVPDNAVMRASRPAVRAEPGNGKAGINSLD